MEVRSTQRSSASLNVGSTDILLQSSDGFPLFARLWSLREKSCVNQFALVNAGAGIASGYYDRFAAFLAESGIPTLVYDYRGIGGSRPSKLRGFRTSVEEWGSKDCAAAIQWLMAQYPGAKATVVGHSIGGFVTGFVTNGAFIDRMLLVSAHTGYWKDYAKNARIPMYLLWHLTMPAITNMVGYFPGKKLRLLEDLPKGIALEWARRRKPNFWWHLRRADGSPDSMRIRELLARFASIRAGILSLRFTDDPFATEGATERLLSLYSNSARKTVMIISPSEADCPKIGHFGFFRSRFQQTLWPRVLSALQDTA